MDFQEYIALLQNNVTEEMFEAMALCFALPDYTVAGCNLLPHSKVKVYSLCRKLTGDECCLIINYHNRREPHCYSKEEYMVADNNTETLLYLSDHLYYALKNRQQIPRCLKRLCQTLMLLPKRPSEYFGYTGQPFYQHILDKHHRSDDNYLERLQQYYAQCLSETRLLLAESGLLKSRADWQDKTNTVILTYPNNTTQTFRLFFDIYGFVSVHNEKTHGCFCCYVTEEDDIATFTARMLRFARAYG